MLSVAGGGSDHAQETLVVRRTGRPVQEMLVTGTGRQDRQQGEHKMSTGLSFF